MNARRSLIHLSLDEAAGALASGAISAVELTQAYLAAIDQYDPVLHAYVMVDHVNALDAAHDLDQIQRSGKLHGPLHGIPVAIKDIIDVAGMPTLAGSASRAGHIAAVDANIVARLRAAGAVILGKLRTYELAFGSVEAEMLEAIAANPWDLSRWTGASSSGAGSAVAGRLCMAAIGSDSAGSTRAPASLCGVVGFKPARGSVELDGFVPLAPSLDMAGVLARSVTDVRRIADVLASDPAGRNGLPRIAVVPDWSRDVILVQDVMGLMDDIIARLEMAGASICIRELPPLRFYNAACFAILIAEANDLHAQAIRDRPHLYGTSFRERLAAADLVSLSWAEAVEQRPALETHLQDALAGVDVLLTPTTGGVAPLVENLSTLGFLNNPQLTTPFSLAGFASISIPAGKIDGLPFGIQLAARDNATVLRAAAWIEAQLAVGPMIPPLLS
ncbi:amidase [Brucella intermedia]|uniref:amidase n=1 Tax=Brucella intermedia TaxID=94625 RepID=UPI00224B592E|nr:amidase [Brucella intermedia]